MTGRNDPCPCGSGRKFKKCCLNVLAEARAYSASERASAHHKLFEFGCSSRFEGHRSVCTALYWGSVERADEARAKLPDEVMADELFRFELWAFLDAEEDGGRTILDYFLAENELALSSGERAYLERIRSSHLALYEVEEVRPGEGMRLRDVWQGGSTWVVERSATRQLNRWDMLGARVFSARSDEFQVEGDMFLYGRRETKPLLEQLKRDYAKFSAHTLGDKAAFLKRCGFRFHELWLDLVVFRSNPEIVTPEGAPMELGESKIAVGNVDILREGLSNHDAFAEGPIDVWTLDHEGKQLATISLEGSELLVVAISRDRLQRARKMLRAAAPDAGLKHRSTTYLNPAEAIAQLPPKAPVSTGIRGSTGIPGNSGMPGSSGMTADQESEIVLQFKMDHYRRWIDEGVPALGNRTPREAARHAETRPQVVELLKSIENGEARERNQGRPAIDIDWIWTELGLDG